MREKSRKIIFYVDWNNLQEYEKEDNTTGAQELACSSGSCELVDIK